VPVNTRLAHRRSDDIGVLEKDGQLRIIDRKNGLIVSGGENVYATRLSGC
jgi:acyl-CoA synthetase (AMP-forming)/AMP-acid ligase II